MIKVGTVLLAISLILMILGLWLIIYEKTRPGITIEAALSELGESGGTIYFKPGYWTDQDKCVSKAMINHGASTITFTNAPDVGIYQIFSGTGVARK